MPSTSDERLAKVPQQNDDMAWRIVDDECIIVDPRGSQATVLNSVAARIWELIDGKSDVATIVETIVQEYSVDNDTATTDTLDFVDDLAKRNLITFSD